MARIRSAETAPERMLRSLLFRRGLRFRKNCKQLAGCPDIVFAAAKVVVFVDGDFWHGWRFPTWRQNLEPYWQRKIECNRQRDRRRSAQLRRSGWRVVRVWEHDVKFRATACAERIHQVIVEQLALLQ